VILTRRWEDNIKIYLKVLRYYEVDWIDLFHVGDLYWCCVNAMKNLRFLLRGTANFLFSPNDSYQVGLVECSVSCRLEFVLLIRHRIWSGAISFLSLSHTH
jgi:hypothetical protein